jgi:hypothetical protein
MRIAHGADELAARVHEVALAIEVVVAQGLDAHPVDGAHEVPVRDGMRGLLDAPQVLREAA